MLPWPWLEAYHQDRTQQPERSSRHHNVPQGEVGADYPTARVRVAAAAVLPAAHEVVLIIHRDFLPSRQTLSTTTLRLEQLSICQPSGLP